MPAPKSALTRTPIEPSAAARLRHIHLLPLAITAEDATKGCIAGIDSFGNWVRPQPIPLTWALDSEGPFRYGHWTTIEAVSETTAPRPEDMTLAGQPVRGAALPGEELAALVRAHSSATVDQGFMGARSAAVVPARVEDLYARRHTHGRVFLRLVFEDASGERFDWIMPEVATKARFATECDGDRLNASSVLTWLEDLAAFDVRLAIGLTLPSRPPTDRFKGCQPLVVGLHRLLLPADPIATGQP